jgi:acetoin utilization protein AcuC
MKTAFVYTREFARFDYGPAHPLRISRLQLAYELINAYGLLSLPYTLYAEAEASGDEDLLLFHDREYLEILKAANAGLEIPGAWSYGLGSGDNPVFRGLLDWSRLVAGASLKAARMVDSGEADIAFNIAGGLHHALASKASGFCYINDPVITIISLLRNGRRVAYVDIDAHHGDGVQAAFYDTDKVLTISIHETGRMLFPGTGFEDETGTKGGEGYAVNVPMPPASDDEIFLYAFEEIVQPLIGKFSPDIVVTQFGVDSFMTDPLADLRYTNNGFCEAVRRLKDISGKLVALGGGGYDLSNVAKAWTLAWAIMNGVEIPDALPEDFLKGHYHEGFGSRKIRDEVYIERGMRKERMRKEVERVVGYIKEHVFPKVSGPEG